MIRSNAHAFEILEKPQPKIPYEAIRFLYYQPPGEDIRTKVTFWLENAYNENALEGNANYDPNTPVWFAIVAENYAQENLMNPVINLFTTVEEDWDLMNEQGAVLITRLCQNLGDTANNIFLNKILEQIELNSKLPYLYLFECFRFIDPAKYAEQILALLQTKCYWLEALLSHLPKMHFSQKIHPELLAKIHEKLALMKLEYEMMETLDHIDRNTLKEVITCQETLSKADYPNIKISHQERGDWEAHLRSQENLLESPEESTEAAPPPTAKTEKISRNAPCPCGSGKKYKRCCL